MVIEKVILDFDGTLTDVTRESQDFVIKYKQTFCETLNLEKHVYLAQLDEMMDVLRNRDEAGFIIHGMDICPAKVDPYILPQAAAQRILHRSNICSLEDSTDILVDIYLKSIGITNGEMHYREGKQATTEFLKKILNKFEATVITNSSEEKVKDLIEIMKLEGYTLGVQGEAKKLFVDPEFTLVAESSPFNTLPRKPLLRRNFYYNVLKGLEDQGYYPWNTLVVGDIYEFDLALPEHLGYETLQLLTEHTPKHEIEYQKMKGRLVRSYSDILEFIEENR